MNSKYSNIYINIDIKVYIIHITRRDTRVRARVDNLG